MVFVFLRNVWATVIPSIAVPLSLVGTFGVMYLLGYTLDNLSLMALTISTGFVVDDAIVVIENIARHLEAGMKPFAAALQGSREIGFTVISMSTSLVAVFIPILMMAGIVGRLFREFAVTLSIAIGVSLVVSLTTTPMMCARFLSHESGRHNGRLYRFAERGFDGMLKSLRRCLRWVLRHQPAMLAVTHHHHLRQHLSLRTPCPKDFSRSRIPAGFPARSSAIRIAPSPQSPRKCAPSRRSFRSIPRSIPSWRFPAAAPPTPLACSASSNRSAAAKSAPIR